MDDIELAFGASAEVGRLYKDGKSFSVDTPVMALSFLRGLAVAFCNCLDRGLGDVVLAEKINSLAQRGMLKPSVRQQLRILQTNGNKAAHPENYDFVDLDFPKLAMEALEAARGLIEHLYVARHEDVPAYELVAVESGALKEMCTRAMLERDPEAMSQAGEYFMERAEKFEKLGLTRPDRYPAVAGADIEQSMFWFKQGADNDHPNCAYRYGYYLTQHLNVERQQELRGEWYISQAARADHPDAVFYLAHSALEGLGSFSIDEAYALELFERAAELGNPKAVSQVGAMYAVGLGCEASPQKAAHYTLKAAHAGVPQAQYNLSVLHAKGIDGLKNEAEAVVWLQESAAQGFPQAVYDLACFIMEGRVPGRAPAEAEAEFEKAMNFDQYRAHSALLAAQMIHDRKHNLSDLMRAAQHLQVCYEMISKDGDPGGLRATCLETCKEVVGLLRERINSNGPAPEQKCSDVITSLFFDKDCIPFVDWEARWAQVTQMFLGLARGDIGHDIDGLLREACLTPPKTREVQDPARKKAPLLLPPGAVKPGRNDPCPCRSGIKFKRCHGP